MKRISRGIALSLAVLATAMFGGAEGRADEVVALVPAYFYPTWWSGSPWDDLNAAAARIPIEAIMNPASGPGTAANPDYAYAVGALKLAGGKVIGYVPTGYGSRAPADVLADVAAYVQWYGVDGIFLDEMGNQLGDLDYVGLYTAIKAYAAGAGVELHVVGNPGSPFIDPQAFLPAADTLVIFEGPYANVDPNGPAFQAFPNDGPYAGLAKWWLDADPSQIAMLVYDTPTPLKLLRSLAKAVRNNAAYVFITDDQLPNPWDSLPSYWDNEVSLIEILNCLH
jgi:hypothetical protein